MTLCQLCHLCKVRHVGSTACSACWSLGRRHARLPPTPLSSQIIAICPFLAVDQASPRQWFLRQLTRAPVTLAALAGGIGHLPAALKKLIVTGYAGPCSAGTY